jgi:hypothetical protein
MCYDHWDLGHTQAVERVSGGIQASLGPLSTLQASYQNLVKMFAVMLHKGYWPLVVPLRGHFSFITFLQEVFRTFSVSSPTSFRAFCFWPFTCLRSLWNSRGRLGQTCNDGTTVDEDARRCDGAWSIRLAATKLATGGLFAWTDWTVKLVKFDTNQNTKWVIRVMQKISVLTLSIFHVCYLEKEIGSWRGNP